MDCVFCKIVKGEIPASKLYEDDDFLAFLDIMPANKGHALVIPKKHYEKMLDVPDDTASKMMLVVKKIAGMVVKGINVDSYNIVMNNGKLAGQVVPHAHIHIIPRLENDGLDMTWSQKKYEDGELDKYLKKIKG